MSDLWYLHMITRSSAIA